MADAGSAAGPGPGPTVADEATRAELERLETSLWMAATRYDPAYLEDTFHPDFWEVGQSGRTWTRAESMALTPSPGQGEIAVELPLPGYAVTLLAPDVALAHYLSRTDDGTHHRTSVWLRTSDGWRLRFHQGTPAAR